MENKIKEAIDEIQRGTAEIIDIEAITKLIKKYFETGENFYVKAGFDPTAPDIHLGHTVFNTKISNFSKIWRSSSISNWRFYCNYWRPNWKK